MTNKEAIKRIEGILDPYPCAPPFSVETCKALEMAIDALKLPEIIHCKDCKFFELDHFEKVEGFPIPIIVAHEICMKWGDGCKSSIDGWCFMAERRTNE